jgi:hypothetical protein
VEISIAVAAMILSGIVTLKLACVFASIKDIGKGIRGIYLDSFDEVIDHIKAWGLIYPAVMMSGWVASMQYAGFKILDL